MNPGQTSSPAAWVLGRSGRSATLAMRSSMRTSRYLASHVARRSGDRQRVRRWPARILTAGRRAARGRGAHAQQLNWTQQPIRSSAARVAAQPGRPSRNGSTAASFSAIPHTSVAFPSRMWKTWVYLHSALDPSRAVAEAVPSTTTWSSLPRMSWMSTDGGPVLVHPARVAPLHGLEALPDQGDVGMLVVGHDDSFRRWPLDLSAGVYRGRYPVRAGV